MRDLFSANLARYLDNNSLDISHVQEIWPGVETLLEQGLSKLNQTAMGKSFRLSSFGLNQRQSCSLVKENIATLCKTLDALGI